MQSEIASKVAGALQLTLGVEEQRKIAAPPTANLDAYEAYARAEAIRGYTDSETQRAIAYYERAVALDPSFAPAWARLGFYRSIHYYNGSPMPELAKAAREAIDRSLQISPGLAAGLSAKCAYFSFVLADNRTALEEARKGLAGNGRDIELLRAAARAEMNLGLWEEALRHIEQARSLDPRSEMLYDLKGRALLCMRRWPQALAAYDEMERLGTIPLQSLQAKAMVYLAQGDLPGARAYLARPRKNIQESDLVAQMAVYWDLIWVLTDAQKRLLLTLPGEAFGGSEPDRALVLAQAFALAGDRESSRKMAAIAEKGFAGQLKESPGDSTAHGLRALALAYMGRAEEAVAEGRRSLELQPISTNALSSPYYQHQLVRIYMILGEKEKALDLLEPLLKIPYFVSPGWLKIDPNFDPLRGMPRFEKLVNSKPVVF